MKKPIKNVPLVSIITPLYNAEKYIIATLKSVQAQTHTNWEQLVVNDCSTDNSLQLAEELAKKDTRIKVITLSRNSGAAQSRNKATELATGDYIAFLDADDLWHPEKLEKQLKLMQEHHAAVSYTSYTHINEEGNALGKRIKALPKLTYQKQHSNNYVGNLTGMYKAAEIGKIIAPNIRKRQDWAVWLEAIKKSNRPALGIQEDLAYYRIHESSMSSNKLNLVKYNFKFYKEYLGYSWIKSAFYLLRFFYEYFFVRTTWVEKTAS
ncbi:glycosyltransferase family 2 protein [uncultured Dokdonia sp.]|uniref:glycosyltransferase family 2 protein n=1 Tax=uncultured Dokdonia sp. TaxID=575653 RepID=UPI002612EFA5|nr:glycosyltransferase family 2 protein [uncultured Dokdonia sp.]